MYTYKQQEHLASITTQSRKQTNVKNKCSVVAKCESITNSAYKCTPICRATTTHQTQASLAVEEDIHCGVEYIYIMCSPAFDRQQLNFATERWRIVRAGGSRGVAIASL